MLLVASVAVLVAFLLAIELCRNVRGAPAFMAVFLLCVSPLFFAQAMLAQLDMPAMLFTCLALLLFLQDKIRLAALACTALVLVKETGLLVAAAVRRLAAVRKAPPRCRLVSAARRWRSPAGCWCWRRPPDTSSAIRNSPATTCTILSIRCDLSSRWAGASTICSSRISIGSATIAILLAWRRGVFATRAWRIAWLVIGIHVLFLSVVGGAMLERYLLPVLPIVYTAMVAAMSIY